MKLEYLFPTSASTFAWHIDALYWALVLLSAVFTVLIFGAILWLGIQYRRTPERQSGVAVHESKLLELTWSVIPLVLGLGIFAWSAYIYINTRSVPDNALEVTVVGKQWMWKVQHPEGRREINELHIPVGRPVVLRMISQDVIHSFYVPAFRIKQDVVPQRYSTMWFEATKTGKFHLFCTEYCGKDHSEMVGSVHVMTQQAYDQWVMSDPTPPVTGGPELAQMAMAGAAPSTSSSATGASGDSGSMAEQGGKLFATLACVGCHAVDNGVGPKLDGLWGTTVELTNGKKVKFDENYVRESILNPAAKLVKGYNNLMPPYVGRTSEEDILAIIAYVKSLGRTK